MDTLTHALAGALIARASAPSNAAPDRDAAPGWRLAAGFFAAAFPDADFVLTLISPDVYLLNHRGATHSVLLLPLWALLLAFVFARLDRGRSDWRSYFGVCALGIGSHIAFDLITAFGTMALWPLTDRRFALSFTYIIDLFFSGIVLAGLVACALWRRSRAPALAALGLLAAYLGLQALLQSRAAGVGEDYARAHAIAPAQVSAQARPPSPFNWMVVVAQPERLHYALISLWRDAAPPAPGPDAGFIESLSAPYYPPALAQWTPAARFGERPQDVALAKQAWEIPGLAFYRWFAEYPVLLRVDRGNPSTCVWFQDLRFYTPGRGNWPFRFGACREGGGDWAPSQLLGDGRKRPLD